uniref:Uncharacterized protein n=1 Tax=Rhizophora mucronata TaxID=61149 RepID=A0A2P2R279_RHIMU
MFKLYIWHHNVADCAILICQFKVANFWALKL